MEVVGGGQRIFAVMHQDSGRWHASSFKPSRLRGCFRKVIWKFHGVANKLHKEVQRAAAIEMIPGLSSGGKATPSRKATNLPEVADTRSPGTRMPTRLRDRKSTRLNSSHTVI